MKSIFSFNFVTRIIFLLLTPIFFQLFAIGFIWHSIYWGVLTLVVLIWMIFILISPLFGRIGCGWFCFMGTTMDLSSQHSIIKMKWKKPKVWLRFLILIPFLYQPLFSTFSIKRKELLMVFPLSYYSWNQILIFITV